MQPIGRWLVGLAAASVLLSLHGAAMVQAAETTEPLARSKTVIVLKFAAAKTLRIQPEYDAATATLTIRFPKQRVIGWLPERSPIAKGVIQSITAAYEPAKEARAPHFLDALHITLTSSYPYDVRSEAGRVVVEIEHPSSIRSTALELGLQGGVMLGGSARGRANERFRAMQEALVGATHRTTAAGVAIFPPAIPTTPLAEQSPVAPTGHTAPSASPRRAAATAASPEPSPKHLTIPGLPAAVAWMALAVSFMLVAAAGMWLLSQGTAATTTGAREASASRLSSGIQLVDQLIWRAFERQGFQLVVEMQLKPPLPGTLRVVMREGAKAALLFISNGPFLEKQTVERFVRIMAQVNVGAGMLVTSGAFTVPAQRCAKEHHVELIGREQLAELLSVGASSELTVKQLEQQQAKLDEATQALQQYAADVDSLRRQRNEASWFLGEERAKSATLDAQLQDLTQQVSRYADDVQRWQQEAATLRKHWEESEWYLGESRARIQHMEAQLAVVQEIAHHVEPLQRERDEARSLLGEERSQREALDRQFLELQKHLEESARRERTLRETVDVLSQEIDALRIHGERRRHVRLKDPHATIELWNDANEPLGSVTPRDLSPTGLGVETAAELPVDASCRVALRLMDHDPMTSSARIVWQRRVEGEPSRCQSGLQLTDLPASDRNRIEQFLEEFVASERS